MLCAIYIIVGIVLLVGVVFGGALSGVLLENYYYRVNMMAVDDPWIQLKLVVLCILVYGLVASGLMALLVFLTS